MRSPRHTLSRLARSRSAILAGVLVASSVLATHLVAAAPFGRADRATATTPIQHLVLIMKENRSYDEYFGQFPGGNGATTGTMCDGTVVPLSPTPEPLSRDIDHNVEDFFAAYDNGRNDCFDKEGGAYQNGIYAPYTQMTQSEIPNYWAYASHFGLADDMFSDFHGASFANNLFEVAAQAGQYDPGTGFRSEYDLQLPSEYRAYMKAWGCDDPPNVLPVMKGTDDSQSVMYPCFGFKALPNILSDNGVSWKFYGDSSSSNFIHNSLDAIRPVRYDPTMWSNVVPFSQFTTDASSGNLPSVSWVLGNNLEHPPALACDGENETVKLINAVMNGPEWNSTAIVVVWDEWGGFYDHVVPPQVDNISYGFRVPLLVISPWVKVGTGTDGGYISHTFYSHASFLKTVEDNWGLPSLTARDASANSLMDFMDFTQSPRAPLILTQRTCPALTSAQRRTIQIESQGD